MRKLNRIEADTRDILVDKLAAYEGSKTYKEDLAVHLLENDFATGALIIGTYRAFRYLKDNLEEVKDLFDDFRDCSMFEDDMLLLFDNPELFHLKLTFAVAEELINNIDFEALGLTGEIELNQESINKISEALFKL